MTPGTVARYLSIRKGIGMSRSLENVFPTTKLRRQMPLCKPPKSEARKACIEWGMEKICKNCKWWKPKHYNGIECYLMDDDRYNFDESVSDVAITSEFITVGEDFGCIHFEPKEKDSEINQMVE